MAEADPIPRFRPAEEVVNSVTHGVGLVLSIMGFGALVTLAAIHGTAWHLVGCSIFGVTLVLLYTASTLYHAVHIPRVKPVLRMLDHSAIYLLIAGTYTPFTLVNLRGPWGWTLLGVVWSAAILGIALRALRPRRHEVLAVVAYVAMGWTALVAIKPLMASVAPGGLLLLFLGGVSYTGGLIFYAWRRLPYHHAIWHGFVLAGSVFHFCSILFYVIPSGGG